MAYVTLTGTDTAADKPWTTGKATAVAQNPTEITLGSTGAPKVKEAAMDAASVNQAALKTSSGAVSTSGILHTTLPGGAYGFWVELKRSSAGAAYADAAPAASLVAAPSFSIPTTYSNRISLSTAAYTIYAQQTYVQASPPNYINKADGLIPLFLYAQVEKSTGDIKSVYCADAAPWHYNGPTDIRPHAIDRLEDGTIKKYRKRKKMDDINYTLAEAMLDPVKLQEYTDAFNSADEVYEEITEEIKNKDIALIPRPFEPDADHEVILLNPVGDLIWKLHEMNQHDEFDINELLHDGYFKVQNSQAMNIKTPPTVQAYDFGWKLT